MRVIVAVGGSVLAPDLDPDRVQAFADAVEDIRAAGHDVGVVVGGGPVARDYITVARDLGADEIRADEIGIGVTRLNARLLVTALGDATSGVATDYETAGNALRRGDVPVLGGVAPGQSTDAVAAALSEYTGADLLVYATSVPGVFDADPETDPDATRFDTLAPADLVDVVAGIEMRAGSAAPVDLLAAKLLERTGVRAIVLDGTDPGRVVDAVLDDEFDGTLVAPAGD
ncbi:MAG: UMP kinase [Halobacteriaceae archaeon]